MPIILASEFKDAIEKPHASDALHWLVELQLAKSYLDGETVMPAVIMRICSAPSLLTWPLSYPGGAPTWDPYAFTFTPIEQSGEGDLPQIDLSVDNSTRVLMRYLHAGNGLEGNYCTVFLVPANAISVAYPSHVYQRWDLQIAGAQASSDAVAFRLERANFFSRLAPQDRYVAGRCRWPFGSAECGYVINDVAAYTTCPKTIDACIARGADHASRGLPVLHPGRFGGFPGIPKQR